MSILFRIEVNLVLLLIFTKMKTVTGVVTVMSYDHPKGNSGYLDRELDNLSESLKTCFLVTKEKVLTPLYETITGHSSTKKDMITQQIDNKFFGGLVAKLDLIIGTVYGIRIATTLNALHLFRRGLVSGFSFGTLGLMTLAPLSFIPYQPVLEKEKLIPDMPILKKNYFGEIWNYMPFRKEEKVVSPPPEDIWIEKLFKKLFPGIDIKKSFDLPFDLKDILKSIMETTGTSLSEIVTILILSTITAFFGTLIYDRFAKDIDESSEEDMGFTVEDVLAEFDDNLEVQTVIKEWLTPKRH